MRRNQKPIENAFIFKYDVSVRVTMTYTRCGVLKHIFDSNKVLTETQTQTMNLLSVAYLREYVCETWGLDFEKCRKINGVKSVMLDRHSYHRFINRL